MFFEHKKTYRLFKAEVPDDGDGVVPIGSAVVARPGSDLSILCYGYMRHCALEAAEALAAEGIQAEVVDLRTLRPLDTETILGSVAKTGRALVVHEANGFGGFGGEVAALIAEHGFEHLDAPVTRLTGPEVPGVPYQHDLEDWFMLNPERIAEAARRMAAF
jgi:2-oxoisovalerate dehydrogenase E1 component beta subunit